MNEQTTTHRASKGILRWVTPSYDETALFAMSATSVALFVVDPELRRQTVGAFATPGKPGPLYFLIWAGIILGGLGLSVFHAFSSRAKTMMEKTLMGAFAMAANGMAGIACGMEMLERQWRWWAVFPIWNIVSGIALLYLTGLAAEDTVTDDNATLAEISVGLVVTACIFSYCKYAQHFTWAMTFSICVAYSTTFNRPIRRLFRSVRAQSRQEGTTSASISRRQARRR